MKKAIFHSNLGGGGEVYLANAQNFEAKTKSKNMHKYKHTTNLLFTEKNEILTVRFFSMNTFVLHQK